MPRDIEIAQHAKLQRIVDLAHKRLGIPEDELESYGRYKAKLSLDYIAGLRSRSNGKLILVSAIPRHRPAKARRRRPSGSQTRSIGSARKRSSACASPRSARFSA